MFFVFVDEAGNPKLSEKGDKQLFTVAGLVIHGDYLLKMEKHLKKIKRRHGIKSSTEFKWGSSYAKHGLDYETFSSFREEIFDLIIKLEGMVISSIIDKPSAYKKNYIKNPQDVYKQAMMLIMERIHQHFTDNDIEEPAVFVIDSRNKTDDKRLMDAYYDAIRVGTYYYDGFPRFSETPFFVSSASSAGIQLADYCAGAVHQYYETDKDEWFNLLWPSIRKCPWGNDVANGFGLKVFP